MGASIGGGEYFHEESQTAMPKKSATTWSGGSVKLDTADKKQLVATPQQQHNLSIAPNRNVLLFRTVTIR